MRTSVVALAASAFLLLSAVEAGEQAGQWYVTPMLSAFYADSSRNTDDGFGGAVALGKAREHYNIEGYGYYYSLGGWNDTDLWGVGVDFLRVFYRPERISAFLLAGGGFTKGDQSKKDDNSNAYANLGFGLTTDFSADGTGPALRTEVRYRLDFMDPTENDWVGNIGVQIPFGGK
jgi:OOP family OmpA-OmpF porin